jgi:Binding-protein-dependent transport system inner membrane component
MIQGIVAWFTDPANWQGPDGVPTRLLQHVEYSVVALAIALLIGLPLGLLIGHTGKGTFLVAGIANSLRALPTLGLVILAVLLLAPLIHSNLAFTIPALLVLVLLAVPPILSNAYAGVENVDPQARDAAAGMGMTGGQVLRKVEFPCARPRPWRPTCRWADSAGTSSTAWPSTTTPRWRPGPSWSPSSPWSPTPCSRSCSAMRSPGACPGATRGRLPGRWPQRRGWAPTQLLRKSRSQDDRGRWQNVHVRTD